MMGARFANQDQSVNPWSELYTALDRAVMQIGSSSDRHVLGWLKSRWDHANIYDPPVSVRGLAYPYNRTVESETTKMVQVRRVVDVPSYKELPQWGSKLEGPQQDAISIVQELLGGVGFSHSDWVSSSGLLSLEEIPGPTGPIYRSVGNDMLIHVLKALGAPYYPAQVIRYSQLQSGDTVVIPRARRSLLQRALPRADRHTKNLVNWGILSELQSDENHHYAKLQMDMFTPWDLEHPHRVEVISVKYADIYPRFRTLPQYKFMLQPEAWVKHLKSFNR